MSPTHQDLSNYTTFSQIKSHVPVPLNLQSRVRIRHLSNLQGHVIPCWGVSKVGMKLQVGLWGAAEEKNTKMQKNNKEKKRVVKTKFSKRFDFLYSFNWLFSECPILPFLRELSKHIQQKIWIPLIDYFWSPLVCNFTV